MYFSLEWLSEWLPHKPGAEDLGERLTMAGLEVDSMSPAAPPLSGVVTARIDKIERHPSADRLKLCTIDAGDGKARRIVCGAPNAAAGLHAPFAMEGARLGDKEITAATIRGVKSEGMLCSAAELGLGEDAAGLLDLGEVQTGLALEHVLRLDDVIYKLDLTPNRSDCLGLLGIAREVAALYQSRLQQPRTEEAAVRHDHSHPVKVEEPAACPLYMARVVTACGGALPLGLRERLRRCGVRSVHPVVDVLNYVMLEWGQPMHAFDRGKIEGALTVRYARPGETMTAIGGEELQLERDDLVISDERGVQALAGVIGAQHSAVSGSTEEVILECAFFAPRAVSGRARAHKLQTESARRFERGVDFRIQRKAIERAGALLAELTGAQPGPVSVVRDDASLPARPEVALDLAALERRLGVEVGAGFVERSLTALGCELKADGGRSWRCKVPSWRFDLLIEEDLIEEVGRLYGYDRIPERLELAVDSFPSANARRARDLELCKRLTGAGYYEAVSYSLVDENLQALFCDAQAVAVKNPISGEMGQMCATLWPGLLQALSYNLRHQFERVRLFQKGAVFSRGAGGITERLSLAGAACGGVMPEQWGSDGAACDFYSVKGDVERLLSAYDDVGFAGASDKALHPGRCADVLLGATKVGRVGQLSPQLEKKCKTGMPVFLFELDLGLLPPPGVPQCRPVSPYPSIRCDLAVTMPATQPVSDLIECIRGAAPEVLREILVFDIFTGATVESGCKSVGVGLIFQDLYHTLGKADSDSLVQDITAAIHRFGGSLRGKTERE